MPVKMCNGYDGRRKCGNYAVAGSRYCEEHQDTPKEYERQRSARRREKRKGSYKTKRYLMARRHVLYANPFCQGDGTGSCPKGDLATEVDHIVPLSEGGDLYDLDNLAGRCTACHLRKTARENRGHS
jgi:5-methylcytosine-specific restriction protein A